MSRSEEFGYKTTCELEKLLAKMNSELEEIEEERSFVLKQTGIHLPGSAGKKYEVEIKRLKEKIDSCSAVLQEKNNSRK